jgi:hypothetical protein
MVFFLKKFLINLINLIIFLVALEFHHLHQF